MEVCQYDGKTRAAIVENHTGRNVLRNGGPGEETLSDVAARATRVIERIRTVNGNVLLFSHRHFRQLLAACWLGLPPIAGPYFSLDTGAVRFVGYHHVLDDPVRR